MTTTALTQSASTKTADTQVPLHRLLAERWSPRALDPTFRVSDDELVALLEAARWAPSAGNSQPWRFAVARRGEPAFDAMYDVLAPGNRHWAGAASALVMVAAEVVDETGSTRPWAAYDAGQAAAHLSVQAAAMDLSVHQLGGFDHDAAARLFDLSDRVRPMTVIAIGRRSDDVELAEPFATRERAPRTRLPLDELMLRPAAAAMPLSA